MTKGQKAIKYAAITFAVLLSFSIIAGIIEGISILSGGNTVLDSMQTHEITKTEQINSLDVEISAAEFTVTLGDEFALESNLKNVSVDTIGDELVIKEKNKLFGSFSTNKTPKVHLVLPDIRFEEVEIQTGAGEVMIEKISAKYLSFEFGAGQVLVKHLMASDSAEIEGGAGEFTIENGSLHNLDFDVGVGEGNLTAKLTGHSSMDCGVGELNAYLVGVKADYKVEIKTGLGGAYLDGKKVENNMSFGDGASVVKIDGGVGEVNVRFKEQLV